MVRKIILLTVLLVGFPTNASVRANGNGKWYFAISPDTGQIISYNVDGIHHVLIDSGVDASSAANYPVWRQTDQFAFAILTVHGNRGIYLLTSTAAQLLPFPAGLSADSFAKSGWIQVGQSGDYMLLVEITQSSPLIGRGLLVSPESVRLLTGQMFYNDGRPVFSLDGKYLRYFSRKDKDSQTWTLWQQTLTTGEAKALYTFDSTQPAISYDSYSQHWWVATTDSTTQTIVHILIDSSGKTQVLAQEQVGQEQGHFLLNGGFFSYPYQCDKDCAIHYKAFDSGQIMTFALPPMPDKDKKLFALRMIDSTHLLAYTTWSRFTTAIWLLGTDGSMQIGFYSSLHFEKGLIRQFSPDNRYLLTINETADAFSVWDFQKNDYVFQSEPGAQVVILEIHYGTGGFVLSDEQHVWLYRYSDSKKINLRADIGKYFDVLPDATVLYYGIDTTGQSGIFRYDPRTDKSTLLVSDGFVPNVLPLV